MKAYLFFILALLILSSCYKDVKLIPNSKIDVSTSSGDTISNNAKLRIQLIKDSVTSDETMLVFKNSSSLSYSSNEDVAYMAGFGQVSLSTISSDHKYLSVNSLPYSPGLTIGLNVSSNSDAHLTLAISYEDKMPPYIQVWLKDNYLKDSVNICNANYSFNVLKADISSFGDKRFLVKFTYAPVVQTTSNPN